MLLAGNLTKTPLSALEAEVDAHGTPPKATLADKHRGTFTDTCVKRSGGGLTQDISTLVATLEHVGAGCVILGPHDQAIALNTTARQILKNEIGPCTDDQECEWANRGLKALTSRTRTIASSNKPSCMLVSRESRRDIVLQRKRVSDSCSLMFIIDLDMGPRPQPEVLRRLFGLTAAEAHLAMQISNGASPLTIARTNGVSITTVRSQLTAIFSKTDTTRQGELVSLLSRMALVS